MTVDQDALHTWEILEETGDLTHREKHLFEITKDLRDERDGLTEKLAELTHRVGHARSQCRKENKIICELYEIEIGEGGDP